MKHRMAEKIDDVEHLDTDDKYDLVALPPEIDADDLVVAWIGNERYFGENGPADKDKLHRADGTFMQYEEDDRLVLEFDDPVPEAPLVDENIDGGSWFGVVRTDEDPDYGQDFSDYGGTDEGPDEVVEPGAAIDDGDRDREDRHGVRT